MSNVRTWESWQDRAFELHGRHVDPARRRIRFADESVEVEPRVMAVLLVLCEHAGETVRRDELIRRIWNDSPGADQSLNNAVSLLRRALRDDRNGTPIITTVPKQGYRLRPSVARADRHPPSASPSSDAVPATASAGWRRLSLGLAGFAVVASLIAAISLVPGNDSDDSVSGTPPGPRSIAVLPFENLSPDPADAFFADGLAEELMHTLSQVESLEVAPRRDASLYRERDRSAAAIAESLHVANLLQGTVRREGSRLRVTAQLIAATDNAVLWSTSYDRPTDEVLVVQRDIAINITEALVDEINGTKAVPETADVPAKAYEAYLIGKHELRKWTPEANRRAVTHLERAVSLAPEFAEAHVALGRAYYFAGTHYGWLTPEEAIPKVKSSVVFGISARSPATRALALAVYGDVLAWGDKDWSAALLAYQRAHELSGTPALGLGLTYSILGRHDDAIAVFDEVLNNEAAPTDTEETVSVRNNLAWAYFNARRYAEARQQAQRVLAKDDRFADAYRVLGRAQLMLGDAAAAYESFSTAARLMNGAPVARADQAVALARAGDVGAARDILSELESSDRYVPAPLLAQIHVSLGETDAAIDWIEQGVADAERGVVFLGINPLYDPIRDEPRFRQILAALNLPL